MKSLGIIEIIPFVWFSGARLFTEFSNVTCRRVFMKEKLVQDEISCYSDMQNFTPVKKCQKKIYWKKLLPEKNKFINKS